MWQPFMIVKCNSCISTCHRRKMFLKSLESQLNLLFEMLMTTFLNLSVSLFQVTIGRTIKSFIGHNKDLIG